MTQTQPGDLVIVVPGIMGSRLERNGSPIWDATLAVMGRHALSGFRDLRQLVLPPDIGDDKPDDGIRPVELISDLHVFPGLSAIDGYHRLLAVLTRHCNVTGDRLVAFPYDWRLSVRANACRLARTVARWRKRSGNPNTKVIFICHSMGGLIARYYLDVLGGGAVARSLFTIGTPYRGSPKALLTLANGVAPQLGPISDVLSEGARSFPSTYQLLPTYRCVLTADGTRVDLAHAGIDSINTAMAADGARLHDEISDGVMRNGEPAYAVHAFGGFWQPTAQTVQLAGGRLKPRTDLDGEDHQGDSTVPRFSCFPPDWPDDTRVRSFAQKHGALQNTTALLRQIEAILTPREPGRFLAPGDGLTVDLPDIVADGRVPIMVETADDELHLGVTATDVETGAATRSRSLRNEDGGRYTTTLDLPAVGAWRITIGDGTPMRRVEPVTGIVINSGSRSGRRSGSSGCL